MSDLNWTFQGHIMPRSDNMTELLMYGYLLVLNRNTWLISVPLQDIILQNSNDLDFDLQDNSRSNRTV